MRSSPHASAWVKARPDRPPPALTLVPKGGFERWASLIEAVVAAGPAVPCVAHPEQWVSERSDERAVAARICQGCPVLGPCRSYAALVGDKWSVLGAVDYGPARAPTDKRVYQRKAPTP